MLFPEEDASLLKAWIVKRLENTSDADADVLADYVLALLRHDGSVDDVRKLCEAEIPDFLKEDSSVFVNDVFESIQYKSYLPGAPPPPKRQAQAPAAIQPQPLPYGNLAVPQPPALGSLQNGSRKRSYHERGDVDMPNGGEFRPAGGKSYKQPRRGRGGRADDGGSFRRNPMPGGFSNGGGYQAPHYGALPGTPAFDPNNISLDVLLQLQTMDLQLPQLPDFSQQGRATVPGFPPRRRQRCRDYDTKGYCARGSTCMFEHGTDSIFVPPTLPLQQPRSNEEYDPSNATMMMGQFGGPNLPKVNQALNLNGTENSSPRDNKQANHVPQKRRARAPFSADGPVNDRSKSTIVIENIPEEHFSEEEVRRFFSQFGKIIEVSMQPYKHLAIVKFDNWGAANAAYRSPKVIFENRFVKVFWYKDTDSALPPSSAPNAAVVSSSKTGASMSTPASAAEAGSPPAGTEVDMEEFLRKQEEAQKAYEEKQQRVQEVERQREELERRQNELLAKQQEEKQKLYAKLAAIGKKKESSDATTPSAGGSTAGQDGTKASKPASQTEALRAQLAALEAEAKQLGLDPNAMDDGLSWSSRGGGRGGGRGGFFRARGYAPRGFRGGYRGRGGGGPAGPAAYAAYSLDNRPKKVSVTGVDFTVPEKDETLRQYLFGIGEFTDIQTSPAATQITFKDRKTAEKFFYGLANKTIPGIGGQVELSWVGGGGLPMTTTSNTTTTANSPSSSNPNGGGGGAGGEGKAEGAVAGGARAAAGSAQQQKSRSRPGDEHAPSEETHDYVPTSNSSVRDVTIVLEHPPQDQSEMMDYDVADENQWDIG